MLPSQNFTHFVVYTKSSFVEQTTPNSLSFAEAVAKYQAGKGNRMEAMSADMVSLNRSQARTIKMS